MTASLDVDVQLDTDTGQTHLLVRGDLTDDSCPDLVKIIHRLTPTRGTKLLLDLREVGRAEGSALNMLSSHIALLPDRARVVTAATL